MAGERRVELGLSARAVVVLTESGPEVMQYDGITVLRTEDGQPVEQTWIPLGTSPTYADDEALIANWHAALQWSASRTEA